MDDPTDAVGTVAFYHSGPTWGGPEGFYSRDFRAPLSPTESKTWTGLYLWANPDYYGETRMALSIAGDGTAPPPDDRKYVLQLVYVPKEIDNAPPVGTTWQVVQGETLTVEVPTYATHYGLDGYQFEFTVSEVVPEPATGLGLALMVLVLRRR